MYSLYLDPIDASHYGERTEENINLPVNESINQIDESTYIGKSTYIR